MSDADTIGFDEQEMEMDEFLDMAQSVAEAAATIEQLRDEATDLNDGPLSADDARGLLYGRNPNLAKRDIEGAWDALVDIGEGNADRPLVRLVAQYAHMTLDEAETVVSELERINDQYGHLRDDE